MCNKHFEFEHDRHKVPTLYLREHFRKLNASSIVIFPHNHLLLGVLFAECNNTLRNNNAVSPNPEDIESEREVIALKEENIENIPVECKNIVPECQLLLISVGITIIFT